MFRRRVRQRAIPAFVPALLFLCVCFLTACQPADHAVARQMVIEWPEKQRLFVADERIGSVQAFHLGAGAPVLVAQTRTFERSSVRDMQFDPLRQQLWVLGADGLYVYDAQSLALQKRVPLDARNVAVLRIENAAVLLLASDGAMLGRIDTATLLAAWRPALSVRRG